MPYEKIKNIQSHVIIGTKQALKAIKNQEASEVFIAKDADEELTQPIATLASEKSIPYTEVDSMKKLGNAAGIEVKTAVVAIKE